MTVSRFDYWKRHVRREATSDASIRFAPVQLVSPAAARDGGLIEVALATGERVTIRDGASLDLLRAVVSALRGSC